jgi:type IV pilus assembly protein PilV
MKSRSQRGVTIVEMLVALVVLSIGMLGVASLFVVSLRSGGSAIQRTHAVGLASNIADRIRANRRAGIAYESSASAADNLCVGASSIVCTPEQMAKNDIYLWKQEIASAFPGGNASGSIDFEPGETSRDPATYTITVQWKEQGRNSSESAESLSYELQIQVPTS